MVFGNIGRFQLGQDGNFLNDVVDIILGILDVNNLDGDSFSSAPINTIRSIKSVMSARPYHKLLNPPFENFTKTAAT